MDADDISHPERLARQVHWLQNHPDFSLVGCNLIFGGAPAARGYAEHVCWINSLLTETDIANGRFVESPFAHPSVLFRREALERWGGYRAGDFPEDYELWLRWMDGGARMGKLTDKLLTWNDPPARLSRTDTRYDTNAFYRIKAVYLARWLKAHLSSATPSIVVEGAGPVTRRRARFLEQQGVRIQAWVDVHPHRVGKHIHGVPVISPAARPPSAFIVSYVGNRGARDRIRRDLQMSGRVEGRDFICAA
jgi:cellulose synthase/poly-beta-1,6-N-acetylglucosamine synthase-like glycosyltransferase